jgi:PAS domain S-box-containing protein
VPTLELEQDAPRTASEAGYELLRAAFDAAPDAIYLIDDDRRFIDLNEAGARLLGSTREAILAREFGDYSRGEMRLRTDVLWERLRKHGTVTFRHVITSADGVPRQVDVHGRADFVPGRHLFVARYVDQTRDDPILSPREREVMSLIASGLTAVQVADELYLSPMTVRTHVRNAKDKLGANTVAQAIAIALRTREIAG